MTRDPKKKDTKKKKTFWMEHGKTGIMQRELCLLINWCDCSWMWGSKTKTIASEVTRECSTMQTGRWTITGHLAVLLELLCLPLKSTDKMVFVSMMWTVPVTMVTKGLLAVLILIIYCITMRKTISVTSMMITGFSAPPLQGGSFDFWFYGDLFILRIFHVIFLEPFIC